jgi:cardiolipin synthase
MILNYQSASHSDGQHTVKIVQSGNPYFDLVHELIKKSQSEIHLHTYIFENDSTGAAIIKSLIQAANRGVKIYVLADGYGSSSLKTNFIKELNAKFEFDLFEPWFSNKTIYLGRRLHQKIILIDRKEALIGGINFADKYHGKPEHLPWLDYALHFKGPICNNVYLLCRKIGLKHFSALRKTKKPPHTKTKDKNIQLLNNDWVRGKNQIYHNYISEIRMAKKEIILIASYFLPGFRLKRALKKAAERGVKIKIILSGPSDVPIVKQATEQFYFFLLQNNIEIYEWKHSILHAKVAYADGHWISIGSFNLNHLSTYASLECNVAVYQKELAADFRNHLEEVLQSSEPITNSRLKQHLTLFVRIRNFISYQLVRIVMNLAIRSPYRSVLKKHLRE